MPILSSTTHLPHTHFEPTYGNHAQLQSHSHHVPLQYETTNFVATPYHDKRMVNKIQKSLNHAVYHSPIEYPPSYGGQGSYGSAITMTSGSQNKYSNFEPHQSEANKRNLPRVVNLQYNSPMGLYSTNTAKEELLKKLG